MLEEVRLVEPSSVSFAPRIWNQLQAEYMQAVRERPYAEDEVVERFAGLFGKRLRLVVTGGAATSNSVLQWLYKVWGRRCAVSDSYGITEAGGLAYDGDRKDSVQMKLEDWEEYRSTDLPLPRGELLVRTPAMFAGYYGQADATKEALTSDGFFRTGDIVEATVNGHGRISRVKVIGRRKVRSAQTPTHMLTTLLGALQARSGRVRQPRGHRGHLWRVPALCSGVHPRRGTCVLCVGRHRTQLFASPRAT